MGAVGAQPRLPPGLALRRHLANVQAREPTTSGAKGAHDPRRARVRFVILLTKNSSRSYSYG